MSPDLREFTGEYQICQLVRYQPKLPLSTLVNCH
jgi:hypothetical protein